MKLTIQKDQNDVCFTDIHKPFKTHKDAITRLTPYHVISEPSPNARMQHKGRTHRLLKSSHVGYNDGDDDGDVGDGDFGSDVGIVVVVMKVVVLNGDGSDGDVTNYDGNDGVVNDDDGDLGDDGSDGGSSIKH
jgi:hypothetical protein